MAIDAKLPIYRRRFATSGFCRGLVMRVRTGVAVIDPKDSETRCRCPAGCPVVLRSEVRTRSQYVVQVLSGPLPENRTVTEAFADAAWVPGPRRHHGRVHLRETRNQRAFLESSHRRLLMQNNRCSDGDPIIQVGNIVIRQPRTAVRYRCPDCPGLVGSVDPQIGIQTLIVV